MSACAIFQLSSWSRSGLKVPGGVVGGVGCSWVGCGVVGWGVVELRPILVFILSLSQAEQQYCSCLISLSSNPTNEG